MSNNFFSTSKVLEGMLEDLPLFSDDDLNDLKDAITDELKAREHKQMMPRENSGAIFFVQKEKDIIPLLFECPYKLF